MDAVFLIRHAARRVPRDRIMPAEAVFRDARKYAAVVAHEDVALREMRRVLGFQRVRHIVALRRVEQVVHEDGEIRILAERLEMQVLVTADRTGPLLTGAECLREDLLHGFFLQSVSHQPVLKTASQRL